MSCKTAYKLNFNYCMSFSMDSIVSNSRLLHLNHTLSNLVMFSGVNEVESTFENILSYFLMKEKHVFQLFMKKENFPNCN